MKHAFVALLTLATLARCALGQFTAQDMMRPEAFTNEYGEVFTYRIHAPQFPEAEKEPLPIILFLHGSGECGTDNYKQIKVGLPTLLDSMLKKNLRAVVVAPQCQRMMSGSWVNSLAMTEKYAMKSKPTGAMEVALEICDHVIAQYNCDTNRFYITGLSLGGFGTWDAIQRYPERFAAAAPICGGGDVRIASRQLKEIPLWVAHGADDKNVPVDCSRRMVEVIKLAGNHKVVYKEYPKAGHAIWDRVYADKKFIDWLFKQTRKKPWWKFW